MIKKILIANRGEIALRVIRACKELNIKTVAVYSEADKLSLHTRFADEAVCIGPASGKDSYLKIPNLISAAEVTNADAIHPGYGFLAESAEFIRICEKHDINFIGPSVLAVSKMGDKSVAKETMRAAGVPVVPGSVGVVKTYEDALRVAGEIGFPLLLKAVAGGGGKGMRFVYEPGELEKAFLTARTEAEVGFGNPDLYIEKIIEDARHIEIQVMGDKHGNIMHFNERECSIQRRNQKLIEEAPSPVLSAKKREEMGKASILGAASVNYVGPGTIEYLFDKDENFYFMEMNTRIQVEHCVTEESLSVDLIKEQIRIAAGAKLHYKQEAPRLHSIECRINAEDPYHDFRPCPGTIESLHFPGGRGVRIDSHIYAGYSIPPHYDSMIAKVIATAWTRHEAISKMHQALSEMVIEGPGIKTTIPFHKQMMKNPDFISGNFDTKYLERNDWRKWDF